MTFAAGTAGDMAQIIVMLLVAVAFTDWLRGALRFRETVVLLSGEGVVRRPNHRYAHAAYALVSVGAAIAVIVFDAVVLVFDVQVRGVWGVGVACANLVVTLALGVQLFLAIRSHYASK